MLSGSDDSDTAWLAEELGAVRMRALADDGHQVRLAERLDFAAREGLRMIRSAGVSTDTEADVWEQHLIESEATAHDRMSAAYVELCTGLQGEQAFPWAQAMLSRLTPQHSRLSFVLHDDIPLARVAADLLNNPRIRRRLFLQRQDDEKCAQELRSVLANDPQAMYAARLLEQWGVTRLGADNTEHFSTVHGKQARVGSLDRQELHAQEVQLVARVRAWHSGLPVEAGPGPTGLARAVTGQTVAVTGRASPRPTRRWRRR